jgi:hypothetical protein
MMRLTNVFFTYYGTINISQVLQKQLIQLNQPHQLHRVLFVDFVVVGEGVETV